MERGIKILPFEEAAQLQLHQLIDWDNAALLATWRNNLVDEITLYERLSVNAAASSRDRPRLDQLRMELRDHSGLLSMPINKLEAYEQSTALWR